MYLGLFIYAGTLIKVVFDYFDKGMETNIHTPAGKKTWGSWIVGFVCSSLFYAINWVTSLQSNAKNNVSLAIYLFCFAFAGYLAPHLFLKGASWFEKTTDKKLTVTQTTTVEQTGGVPPALTPGQKP